VWLHKAYSEITLPQDGVCRKGKITSEDKGGWDQGGEGDGIVLGRPAGKETCKAWRSVQGVALQAGKEKGERAKVRRKRVKP